MIKMNLEVMHNRMMKAKEIAKSLRNMEADGYHILIRPHMKVGGVVFAIDTVYTKEGPQRFMHFVDIEDFKPYVEPYEEWDLLEQSFVSNITKFGFVWLTCRQNHLPESEKLYWIHPADAEHVKDSEKTIKRLMQELNELKRRNDELSDQNNFLSSELQALNERISDYESKVTKLTLQNEHLSSTLLEYEININRLQSVVNKMIAYYEQSVAKAKEEGKYEAMEGLDKFKTEAMRLQEIMAMFNTMGYGGKEIKEEKPVEKKVEG